MAKQTIQPLGSKVLIERSSAEEKTAGGIVLPDTAKEKPKQGRVHGVGPGRFMENGALSPMHVKSGDTVIFTSYAGTEVRINNTDYMIMDESDILGTVVSR